MMIISSELVVDKLLPILPLFAKWQLENKSKTISATKGVIFTNIFDAKKHLLGAQIFMATIFG